MRPLALQLKSPLILPCDVQKEEEIIALAFAPKTDLKEPKGAWYKKLIKLTKNLSPLNPKASCAMALIYVRNKEKLHD